LLNWSGRICPFDACQGAHRQPKEGDTYVEALLETIIANPAEIDARAATSASSPTGCSAGCGPISLNLQAGTWPTTGNAPHS
jgi:hypothetical protein